MIQQQRHSGYANGGAVPLPQPDPAADEKRNLSKRDHERIAQGIPYSPDGQAYAPDAYMQARVGLAAGGPVQAPDDADTIYPSTAPAWTAGGYAAALGLAGNADQGYARGGPVEPAGANFRRILAHNRRRFGLHQQPAGYAEGGVVEDYDNGDYAPPTYDPNQDAATAAPTDDAAPVTSTLQDPDFNERLAQRTRRPSAKHPPTTDEPPSADTNIVKLLGQAAQRGAEDVGSAVGRGASDVGRSVADTASDVGSAVADKYGSMKDRLAAYVRGDNGHPPEQVQQLIRDKEAADPTASHNDNVQSVFDDFISQYNHDDAGNFVQSLRQPYDQARAVSQAALAQGNIDASVKAFEHAHNLLPNDTNLKLDQQPDGMIRATVAERGGDAQTLTLTPQQYSDWIHSSGSQLDHVGDLGTGRSLNIASQNTAPSQISPQTGYSPANIAQARETAADALNPSATTGYEPQQLVNPPYTEKELYGFGFGGQSVEAIKRAGGYTNALANSLARFLPPGFLKDPGNRANLEAMSDSLIRQKAIGLQPPEIETRDALKSVAQTLLDKANAARTQSSRAPLSPAAPDGVHEHPEISTPGYIRPDDPKLYRQPPSQPDLRPLSPDQSRLGPESQINDQPPAWPRPGPNGQEIYPGGLHMSPTTDPRYRALLGPKGEAIAAIPANRDLSAEDVSFRYQNFNLKQLEDRLRQGDPVAVAAATRFDPVKPLPPAQPATPESMAAANAEMVRRGMIAKPAPSAFEQRLAQETNPAVRKALIDQQGLTQRNQATIQQKAQATAELQLSKREQNVMQNYRSNRTNGVPPNPEEEAVAKKLGQLTLEAMGRQGAQPSAAPATRAPTASAQPPAAAIQALRLNPSLRGQFDAFYGQGAAAQALGGP